MVYEELPFLESFNSLARLYLEREMLINKLANGKETTLTSAEKKVDESIKDPSLLKLIAMLDRFFLIKGGFGSVRNVRSYRNRLNQFVDHTIGLEEYSSLLHLEREKLENVLKKEIENLLKRKETFPILEAQLAILLKWFRR